jgi:hypothetical protein
VSDGPPLAELQRRFFELVTGPEGVAKELAKRGIPERDVAAIIGGDGRASAVERLDIYANMYFFRILDVLRGDYPKLVAVVGDEAFHDLATDYLQAHPSRHPSLRFAGAALPGFLARQLPAGQRPWLAERPWLVDLAALEWARVDVFDRGDADLLAREALATVAPEDFAAIALAPVPASALVPAAWAVEDVWRAVEDERAPEPPAPAADGHAVLVWRRGVTVHHRAVGAGERRALERLFARTTFGALCATLGETLDSEQAAAELAVGCLGQWLADELLARV